MSAVPEMSGYDPGLKGAAALADPGEGLLQRRAVAEHLLGEEAEMIGAALEALHELGVEVAQHLGEMDASGRLIGIG